MPGSIPAKAGTVHAPRPRREPRTLNTTAAALYWHVGSKDGLLDLIFDRVIGEQPVPDPDPERMPTACWPSCAPAGFPTRSRWPASSS
jgi:hypothetical protein